MAYSQHEDGDLLILDVTDKAVVADAISPQTTLIAVKRLTPLSRIVRRLHPLPEKASDKGLGASVVFLYLFFGGAGDLNRPTQGAAPTRRV